MYIKLCEEEEEEEEVMLAFQYRSNYGTTCQAEHQTEIFINEKNWFDFVWAGFFFSPSFFLLFLHLIMLISTFCIVILFIYDCLYHWSVLCVNSMTV